MLNSFAVTLPVAFLLGIGLAMDAFSVSITHGIKDSNISRKRSLLIPLTFGFFQALMPLIGFFIVFGLSSIQEFSYVFSQIVPPLALVLLAYLGIKMIIEYAKNDEEDGDDKIKAKSFVGLVLVQAFATSIDALSSGLAMTDYSILEAIISVLIIGVITFIFCVLGISLGKQFGYKVGKKGELIGGIILILLGIFIFIRGEILANAPEIIPEWIHWLL